jgi:hypothetical protein
MGAVIVSETVPTATVRSAHPSALTALQPAAGNRYDEAGLAGTNL